MKSVGGITFETKWLLLCEGVGDMRFFQAFLPLHGLDRAFFVCFPGKPSDPTGGRGKFGSWLALQNEISESFRTNVKAILIIHDNDDDAGKSFEEVKKGIQAAKFLPVPDAEQQVARKAGAPDVMVLGVPIGAAGCMETLCLTAALSKWPLEVDLNAYAAKTPSSGWPLRKQSKMKMQCLLSSVCEPTPDTSFAWHWQEKDAYRIPLNHPSFNDLAEFLKKFEAKLAAI